MRQVSSADGSEPDAPDDSESGALAESDPESPDNSEPEDPDASEPDETALSPALENDAPAGERVPESDGVFPPGGADLLALLGRVSADAKCRFPDRRGTWSRRIAGATWTPGFFPGDARKAYQLALTFDDGPDVRNTKALLGWLKEAGVQATFLSSGNTSTRGPTR